MTSHRRIRADVYGPYVLTGGYAFRPPSDSKIVAGERVRADHVGGTQTAIVGDETWRSYAGDPRYIEYVGAGPHLGDYLLRHPEQLYPPVLQAD